MFIWRDLFSSVRRRFLILAVVPLLSLLSLYTPFFTQSAAAVSSQDVLKAARAWSMLNAIVDNAGRLDKTISNSDADNCAIFGSSDNGSVYVGHHATENNEGRGAFSADGGSWDALEDRLDLARDALAYVGIQNGCRGLLEILGYTSSGGNMNGGAGFDNSGQVLNRLKGAIKGDPFFGAHLGDSVPGGAISYAILYYDLTKVCGWEYRNPYVENDRSGSPDQSRNNEAQNNGWSGDSNNSHFHTYTYEQNKAGENIYYKAGGRTDDISVGPRSGFANDGAHTAQIDCGATGTGYTVGAMLHDKHGFADAYANLVRPGGQFTPGTCGEKYSGAENTALANACDEGFKNKTPGYCDKFNSDPALKNACLYGQNTATGGAADVTPPEENNEKAADKTTCAIPGIGWILCPVLELGAKLVDGIYAFVSALLKVQPLTSDPSSGTFKAWSVMRNFANIAFVIAFLIIIFSQVTSVGISNYGIKRMLPRLIVSAILVNVSFWICAIAVDLSNIGGASLRNLFEGIGQGLSLPGSGDGFATSNQWQGLVGSLLSGTVLVGIALYIGLSALIPVLIVCLVIIATVFICLIIRQALIILLIVISPLAFVAYLLPNTEMLFTRWRRMFTVLLVLYPVTAVLFGASALASKILMMGS
jgi:hypothetical protein